MNYPEHEKLHLIKDKSQEIGSFLEWLQDDAKIILAEYDEMDFLYPIYIRTEELLAKYFNIDLKKIEQEKRAMLDEIRKVNEA